MGTHSGNSDMAKEGESASRSVISETWEPYGVAIFASRTPHWFRTLRRALETGEITARANKKEPPASDNAIYDAARKPTPEWWKKYHSICDDNPPTPDWAKWLALNVRLQTVPTLDVYERHLESMRQHFGINSRPRSEGAWSNLEALAWFSSHNIQLVSKLRSFGHQTEDQRADAQLKGLQYLQFHVARHHCSCASKLSLQTITSAGDCTCIIIAWEKLLSFLRSGLLSASIHPIVGRARPIDAHEFLAATLDIKSGSLSFVHDTGDLLFDKSGVQAASRADIEPTAASNCSSPSVSGKANAPTRAPSVKDGRGPDDADILAKADEMRKRGLNGYALSQQMRLEPGFKNVATTHVRDLIKGRYGRGRTLKINQK